MQEVKTEPIKCLQLPSLISDKRTLINFQECERKPSSYARRICVVSVPSPATPHSASTFTSIPLRQPALLCLWTSSGSTDSVRAACSHRRDRSTCRVRSRWRRTAGSRSAGATASPSNASFAIRIRRHGLKILIRCMNELLTFHAFCPSNSTSRYRPTEGRSDPLAKTPKPSVSMHSMHSVYHIKNKHFSTAWNDIFPICCLVD